MKQDINIDALMADAWLTVTELRFGARLADGEGDRLWRHCVDHIEQVMAKLEAADVSEASRRHILYAWCALLDETAKGREGEDDACIVWSLAGLHRAVAGSDRRAVVGAEPLA